MAQIQLVSSDMQVFEVQPQVAKCIREIREVLEDENVPEDQKQIFLLRNVKAEILKEIVEYAVYNKSDPSPAGQAFKCGPFSWEKELIKLEPDILLQVAAAAYQLKMGELMFMCVSAMVTIDLGPQNIPEPCSDDDM